MKPEEKYFVYQSEVVSAKRVLMSDLPDPDTKWYFTFEPGDELRHPLIYLETGGGEVSSYITNRVVCLRDDV